jgi:DNA-binding NarL/FixJ family response regulator
MTHITVLLVDDQAPIREGLRALLKAETDIEIIGEAENGHQAVAFASKFIPDVVIMDIAMPLLDGLGAIERIRESVPASTKVLVLSSHSDDAYVQHAEAIGAAGYLVKHSDMHALAAAIRDVHSGKPFIRPSKPLVIESL